MVGIHMYIVHITNGMVNSVPTRQIFRPFENSHVFFFCVRAAGVARPSFKWRSLYSRFAVDVVENLLWGRLGLSRPGTVPSW